MKTRNLRDHLLAGAARLILTADGEGEAGGAGGAPAAEPAAGATPAGDGGAPAEGGADTQPAAAGSGDPAGEPGADAGADGDGGEGRPKRVPWQQRRIDQLTAQSKQEREARERAEAEAAEAKRRADAYKALYGDLGSGQPAAAAEPGAQPAPAGGDAPKVYTEEDVRKEAARIASLQTLNQKCETLFEQGAAAHGDEWKKRVGQVGQAFGAQLQTRADFFEALTSLPNGADVYHELAGDLDHLDEVLSLPPLQLGIELAKLSTKAASKPKGPAVSAAPAPIDPVDGNGGQDDTDLTKMDMDSYAKTREKQREERFRQRGYI